MPTRTANTSTPPIFGKGLKQLRKAYGELGYINFVGSPVPRFDEAKKLIYLDIDIDEGKPFYISRIEFQGNTITRDKVIRREFVVDEGQHLRSPASTFRCCA